MVESEAASPIVSIPALAAALCEWKIHQSFLPAPAVLHGRALVPMYRLQPATIEEEANEAVRLIGEVAERMRRLTRAYGEWHTFEPGPYFDLSPEQVSLLIRVSERVSTVHVVFYVDALLPSFQAVQDHAAAFAMVAGSQEHDDMVYTTLTAHWRHMLNVVNTARRRLGHDIGFLALNGAAEEQARWQTPRSRRSTDGLYPWAEFGRTSMPSLTLSVDFPLPAYRQPGRKRRLMRTWQRLYGNRGAAATMD